MSRISSLIARWQQHSEEESSIKTSVPFSKDKIYKEIEHVEVIKKEREEFMDKNPDLKERIRENVEKRRSSLSYSRGTVYSSNQGEVVTSYGSTSRTENTTNGDESGDARVGNVPVRKGSVRGIINRVESLRSLKNEPLEPRVIDAPVEVREDRVHVKERIEIRVAIPTDDAQECDDIQESNVGDDIHNVHESHPHGEIPLPRAEMENPSRFFVKNEALNDIEDTNIENLSGVEHHESVKGVAANSGDWDLVVHGEPCLLIWRIEQFQVVPWPSELYGSFYRGDSYIILYGYLKNGQELLYNVHFWLGCETTQDESGTAAYKTVELDTYLDDLPIQYREVDGQETELFLSYFPSGLIIMEGGVESGFNHIEPESYEPRLLKIKGKGEQVSVRQVPLDITSLNSGDVFILDIGLVLYQFNGSGSSVFEKQKGAKVCEGIHDNRSGKVHIQVIEDGDEKEVEFWEYFGGFAPIAEDDETQNDHEAAKEAGNELYRLSDATGELVFEFVAHGTDVTLDKLDTDDVFIIDVGYNIFVWVGNGATDLEKKSGMKFAQLYIEKTYGDLLMPVSIVRESGCTKETYDKFFH